MQRVLTGYSQYHNRKYRKVGHVFQGRHKAILCEADRYLTELVRYIHLNPVRAKIVRKAERYPWSSQKAYLGIEQSDVVDVDPVLRLFGARKQKAREHFAEFVAAGARSGDDEDFLMIGREGILGSDEFVDNAIHHIWERDETNGRGRADKQDDFSRDAMIAAVESVFDIDSREFLGSSKTPRAVRAKEALIAAGRRMGASVTELAKITGLNTSTISRRYDNVIQMIRDDTALKSRIDKVAREYRKIK
jgi:hypothetical protein